jgi:tetratricopeptide (TPR) repeat protein
VNPASRNHSHALSIAQWFGGILSTLPFLRRFQFSDASAACLSSLLNLLSRSLKGSLMASPRLQSGVCGFLLLTSLSSFCGCASMGGNMANSSGMGYYEKGNFAAASGEFQTAMMNDPSNPDYMANFAKSRLKMGDTASAEQYFRQALTVSPSHQPSYHGLAELMLAQNRGQEANAMLQTWAATQPYVAESHVELAWLQREMGNQDAAVQSLQQALQVNPSHAAALAQMGQHYEEMGRPDQAVAMYQNSLRSDWNQPEVHSRVASVSQQAGATSPMAATAMARGVHPYNIPRQENAFGPPSRGAQMAQMQMQQQMAMAGNQSGMPGAYGMNSPAMMAGIQPGQMNGAPGAGMMSTYYSPSMAMSGMPAGGGWQASGPSMMPMQTVAGSFGPGSFGPGSFAQGSPMMNQPMDTMSWPPGTIDVNSMPLEIPNSATTETAVAPTPDPSFTANKSGTPVKTASWTTSIPTSASPPAVATASPATASTEPPVVEAF